MFLESSGFVYSVLNREISGKGTKTSLEHVRKNILAGRYSVREIDCFEDSEILGFDIVDHFAICFSKDNKIRCIDLQTKKATWQSQVNGRIDSKLFKIVEGKLIFRCVNNLQNIKIFDAKNGEELRCIPGFDGCIANKRLFKLCNDPLKIVECDLDSENVVREFCLKVPNRLNLPPFFRAPTVPYFLHNDQYVVYFGNRALYWIDLEKNEVKELFFSEEQLQIKAACLDNHSFFCTVSNDTFGYYLVGVDLENKAVKKTKLNFSPFREKVKTTQVESMYVQGDQIFFKIGPHLISYHNSKILGKCWSEFLAKPLSLFLEGRMVMFLTSKPLDDTRKWNFLKIKDLTTGLITKIKFPSITRIQPAKLFGEPAYYADGKWTVINDNQLVQFNFMTEDKENETDSDTDNEDSCTSVLRSWMDDGSPQYVNLSGLFSGNYIPLPNIQPMDSSSSEDDNDTLGESNSQDN